MWTKHSTKLNYAPFALSKNLTFIIRLLYEKTSSSEGHTVYSLLRGELRCRFPYFTVHIVFKTSSGAALINSPFRLLSTCQRTLIFDWKTLQRYEKILNCQVFFLKIFNIFSKWLIINKFYMKIFSNDEDWTQGIEHFDLLL